MGKNRQKIWILDRCTNKTLQLKCKIKKLKFTLKWFVKCFIKLKKHKQR